MTEAQAEYPELSQAAPDLETWRVRKQIAKDIAKRLIEKGFAP